MKGYYSKIRELEKELERNKKIYRTKCQEKIKERKDNGNL